MEFMVQRNLSNVFASFCMMFRGIDVILVRGLRELRISFSFFVGCCGVVLVVVVKREGI